MKFVWHHVMLSFFPFSFGLILERWISSRIVVDLNSFKVGVTHGGQCVGKVYLDQYKRNNGGVFEGMLQSSFFLNQYLPPTWLNQVSNGFTGEPSSRDAKKPKNYCTLICGLLFWKSTLNLIAYYLRAKNKTIRKEHEKVYLELCFMTEMLKMEGIKCH